MRRKSISTLFVVLAASAALQSLAAIPIVVIPDKPTAVEKFAAAELAAVLPHELTHRLGAASSVQHELDALHASIRTKGHATFVHWKSKALNSSVESGSRAVPLV